MNVLLETAVVLLGAAVVSGSLAAGDRNSNSKAPLKEGPRLTERRDGLSRQQRRYEYDPDFDMLDVDEAGNLLNVDTERVDEIDARDPFMRVLYGKDERQRTPMMHLPWMRYVAGQQRDAAAYWGNAELGAHWARVDRRLRRDG
jgi:hypothetical protein